MSDPIPARIAALPPSLNKLPGEPGNKALADDELEITQQFLEAIQDLRPRPAEPEHWARFLFGELCGARAEKRRKRKAGPENQSAQAKQLKKIAKKAKCLSDCLMETSGAVFDSWINAAGVFGRGAAAEEWLHLKHLAQIAAWRAGQAEQCLHSAKRTD